MASLLIKEPVIDPVGIALFDSFFDTKIEDMDSWETSFFDGLELEDIPAPIPSIIPESMENVKIVRKRKSLEWDSKPLEKRSTPEHYKKNITSKFSLEEPPVQVGAQMKRKRGRPRKYPKQEAVTTKRLDPLDWAFGPLPFDEALPTEAPTEDASMLSDLFMANENSVKPVSKQLMKSRKSEDWSSKPAGQTKKRMKWSNGEMKLLWEGIAKHGNNWTEIRGMFSSRSYCQIKDKGRRCLFLLGWETGRSKLETDCSSIRAKKLAKDVLTNMQKA